MEKKNSKFKKNTIFRNDVKVYSGLLSFKDKITQMSANYLILNENLYLHFKGQVRHNLLSFAH